MPLAAKSSSCSPRCAEPRCFALIEAYLCRRHPLSHLPRSPRSCGCGRRPEPGDQQQDFLEHLPRHRDLGHLEDGIAPVADDLGADLDQLLAQAGQRPRLRRLRHRQGSHEIRGIASFRAIPYGPIERTGGGPRGEKRPADVIGNAVKVMRIATGEETEELVEQTTPAVQRGTLAPKSSPCCAKVRRCGRSAASSMSRLTPSIGCSAMPARPRLLTTI